MMTRGVGSFLRVVTAVVGLASFAACGGGGGAVSPPPPPPNAAGPVEIFPGTVSVPLQGQVHFTAFLPGTPAAHFTWTVSGSSNGTIDPATGIYVAPMSVPGPATATITATVTGGSTTGIATINITPAQGVAISPAGIAVPAGSTQLFAATVSGASVSPTWQVNGVAGGDSAFGTITANGLYTAPLTPPPGGSTVVTAVSGANSGTAAVTVTFTSVSMNGPYAFFYSGTDSAGPLAVAGRFVANSNAGTLSGLEDYNSLKLKTPAQAQAISGTFVVNPDGSGSATVNDPPIGGMDTWHFALTPGPQGGATQHVLLTRFDSSATGSGAMDQQSPTQLVLSSFKNNYAFGLGGFDPSGKGLQMVGKFQADGFGNIPVNFAVEDINDGGAENTASTADTTLHGTFFLDPANPGTGRGSLQLINTSTQFPGTFNFTFYMVDSTHLDIIENDLNAFLVGACFSAPNTNGSFTTTSVKGNYAFTQGGLTSGNQPLALGGVFATNGSGGIAGGILDTNTNGSASLSQMITASSYTVDPNFGRISLSLTASANTTSTYAAYATSSGTLEMIGLNTTSSVSGQAFPQTSTGPVVGTFGLNLGGVTSGGKAFAGQNIIGEVQQSSSLNSITGSLDINTAGSITAAAPLLSTSSVIATDVNGRGSESLVTSGAGTFDVVFYVVNPNTALLLGGASSVSLGVQVLQF
jgi:hypothetical protein